jgi:hypothetical protein
VSRNLMYQAEVMLSTIFPNHNEGLELVVVTIGGGLTIYTGGTIGTKNLSGQIHKITGLESENCEENDNEQKILR